MKLFLISSLFLLLVFLSCEEEKFNDEALLGFYNCEVTARVFTDTVYQDTVEVRRNEEGQVVVEYSTLHLDSEGNYYSRLNEESILENDRFFNVSFQYDSIEINSNGCNCWYYVYNFKGKKIPQ